MGRGLASWWREVVQEERWWVHEEERWCSWCSGRLLREVQRSEEGAASRGKKARPAEGGRRDQQRERAALLRADRQARRHAGRKTDDGCRAFQGPSGVRRNGHRLRCSTASCHLPPATATPLHYGIWLLASGIWHLASARCVPRGRGGVAALDSVPLTGLRAPRFTRFVPPGHAAESLAAGQPAGPSYYAPSSSPSPRLRAHCYTEVFSPSHVRFSGPNCCSLVSTTCPRLHLVSLHWLLRLRNHLTLFEHSLVPRYLATSSSRPEKLTT
ncbi:hypothetical protein P171DRAFT_51158 [Karstenula rhodostoma CBS 690.94]|uniref:Uncharacterized protein n=1 Tax=Karstenula rhodostoma CBS 690.94 TaxID=1392251 RepID=A0A9P4UB86_9PLEO|nr:hypothetical protein P171DRAFT_51158 [Karstenula rhodostoma CBS 690.94]